MAVNTLGDDLDPNKDFAWLDDISYDDCFMTSMDSYSNVPSKSLDFGGNGYTGSLTAWHELLQITAPDPSCGLVYVRGDFPDEPNSMLARTQRHNAQGTWGLKPELNDRDDLRLTGPDNSGFINLRWPCAQFSLGCDGYEDGTYTMCSLVKENILYQIIRIVPGKPSSDRHGANLPTQQQSGPRKLTFKIGGRVRIGCPRNSYHSESLRDITDPTVHYSEQTKTLSVRSLVHNNSLALRMWVNRQQVELKPGSPIDKKNTVDMTALHEVDLGEDTPTVIVASFSLFNSTSDETYKESFTEEGLPQLILSSIAQDYMGVADSSKNASYRLWKGILSQEDDRYNSRFDFELNTVGRSVEQILCVSSIPMINPVAKEEPIVQSDGSGGEEQHLRDDVASISVVESPDPANEASTTGVKSISGNGTTTPPSRDTKINHKGVALIKNIMSSQWVDLESTFWQIRLLIKAYKDVGLNMSKLPDKSAVYGQPLQEMSILYQEALLKHIELACIWLLNAPLAPYTILPSVVLGNPESEERVYSYLPDPPYSSLDRVWYYTIILWYVLHHCPDALKSSETNALLRSRITSLEHEETYFYQQDDPKSSLLQWYHYSCFLQLWKSLESDGGASVSVNRPENDRIATQEITWKGKSQKSLKPTGKGRPNRALEDPQVVNLALLAEELFSKSADTTGLPNQCVSYAKEFVRNRDWTSILNPGKEDRKQGNHAVQDTSPPWELVSLNHHSLLWPEVRANEEKVDTALDVCQEFLFSDYTFIGSWDRSDKFMVSTWWDLLPSSILAGTLLDRRLKMRESEALDTIHEVKSNEAVEGAETTNVKDFASNPTGPVPGMLIRKPTIKVGDDATDDIVKRLLDGLARASTKQAEEREEFDWRSRRPQRICFPDTVTQSLEDTPELFRSKQLKNVSIRSNVKKYLEKRNNDMPMPDPDWSLDTAAEKIRSEELLYLSCWDLSRSSGHETEIYIRSSKGRVDPDYQMIPISYSDDENTIPYHLLKEGISDGIVGRSRIRTPPTLWSFYLNGYADQHPTFDSLPKSLREKLKDSAMREDVLSRYQRSLFSILNDSFVDLGTQFRIFFIQRYSPIVIQAFIYMWHTDALDSFDDHLGTVSRFFNGQTSSGSTDVWITSITIFHWSLEFNDEAIPRVFDEARGDKAGFPPLGVAGVHRGFLRNLFWSRSTPEQSFSSLDIGQTASSLVITGDEQGFSWTCSVISSIMDESVIAQCAEDTTDILEMFIHQQYSGRSLVFIMFLGHICEKLARENEHFLHTLDTVMDMDQKALLKGIEWQKSQLALRRLKTMLWAMEALRIFDDKLLSALTEIKEARSHLIQELNKEDSLRHTALKRYMENVLEDFDKRYTRLEDSHTSILQLIEQSSRLREGITSVLGVEQNENIGMLTYITIAYLPLGFIAAIFSTRIVPDSRGLGTFGWLIAIFLVGTFIFALSLQTILGATRRFWKAVDRQTSAWEKSFAPPAPRPDSAKSRSSISKLSHRNTHSESSQKDDLESGTRPRTI